jgi:hypothetical protein
MNRRTSTVAATDDTTGGSSIGQDHQSPLVDHVERDGPISTPTASDLNAHTGIVDADVIWHVVPGGQAPANPVAAPHGSPDDGVYFLAELPSRLLRWRSPGRIGDGLLHLIQGDVESGVEDYLVETISCLTKGRALPDGAPAGPQSVLLATFTSEAGTYYRHCLEAAAADLDRVLVPRHELSIPTGCDRLQHMIVTEQVDVLVIPNVLAHVDAGLNPSYEHDCWHVIRGFKAIMAHTGVTVILTRGIQKSASKTMRPIHRGSGSLAWAEAADVVLDVTRDGDQATVETVRLKHGDKPVPLTFELGEHARERHHAPGAGQQCADQRCPAGWSR